MLQNVNCLLAAKTLAVAGSSALTGIDIANLPKPLWQLAGYTEDPGGDLTIIGTLNQAAGAAGTVTLSLVFKTP